MKRAILVGLVAMGAASAFGRMVTDFTDGWSFAREGESFAPVAIPHDWAIAGPFIPDGEGSTGKLPWKGRGTYRKTIVLGAKPKGRFFLDFDGVMARATVFVNGQPCGRGEYGYLGFRADATPYLMAGTNTVEVKCDTMALKSRWYPGGGMYRKVVQVETDPVRLDESSLRVETTDVLRKVAQMKVAFSVQNEQLTAATGTVNVALSDPKGQVVARIATRFMSDPFRPCAAEVAFPVENPRLWEMQPNAALYTLTLTLDADGSHDELTRKVGFREFRFDANEGFILNGRRIQLKGVDLHADLGPLGMAFDVGAARRQLEIMREMGANALRTSHNPPAPEVLDLCDEMGIFVWDECFDKWNATCGRGDIPLEEFVERQLRSFVRRDRIHPCVFAWSIGNEISPGKATPPGQEDWAGPIALGTTAERCARFRQVVREEDATRAVAIGSCFPDAALRGDYVALDLTGWNYRGMYNQVKAAYPNQPLLYSESASALSEFGFYADRTPTNKTDYAQGMKRVDSMDLNAAQWSDIPDREFFRMERDRFCCGEFVWTGIDYLGEPTPYADSRSSYFGICDLLGFPKDRYYLYRSHWRPEAFTLHIAPSHWNFGAKGARRMPVYVYTSAAEAELFLNGRSLGRRRKNPSAGSLDDYYSVMPRYRLMWEDVAYEPGELKTVAYDATGKVLGEKVIRTAGAPVRVVLSPEKRYGTFCAVQVSLADARGNFVPNDDRRISFSAKGCEILAVGNSDPRGYDSFKDVKSHSLKFGRAGVYMRVKPGETANLEAYAEGLASASADF